MPEARIEIELEDGALDAFVACPGTPGRKAPILLLPDRQGLSPEAHAMARRLSAHSYFVLAPDLSGRPAEDRRDAASSCLDYLADERRVDDTRVGVLGFGPGANLAVSLAAARAERIAAVGAYGGRGLGPRTAREIANRINGVVRIGYAVGQSPPRLGILEGALCEAGVDFDIEVYREQPDWPELLDFFARTLVAPSAAASLTSERNRAACNP